MMFDLSDTHAERDRLADLAAEVGRLRRAAARAYSRGYVEAANSEAYELMTWEPVHRARLGGE